MLKTLIKDPRFLYFVGGAVAAILGVKVAKSKTSRDLCVKGVAKLMTAQKNMRECMENIKEEAIDICHDAEQVAAASKDAEK